MKKNTLMFALLIGFFMCFSGMAMDLRNGDVLRCLVDTAGNDGWKLISIYDGVDGKRIVVFKKKDEFRKYVGGS